MQPTLWDFATTKTSARKRQNRKVADGISWRGSGCTLDGRLAFVRPMGETTAVIEPVDLAQEPIYVDWKSVATTMQNGGSFSTPRN